MNFAADDGNLNHGKEKRQGQPERHDRKRRAWCENDEFWINDEDCVSKTRNFVFQMMNFAGGMEAMMESVPDQGNEHATLRLAEADAKMDAEKEIADGLRAELDRERATREEERAAANTNAKELEGAVEALTGDMASLRRLTESRAASSADTLELERRVTELTAELAAAKQLPTQAPSPSAQAAEQASPAMPPPAGAGQAAGTLTVEGGGEKLQALQQLHEAQRAGMQVHLDTTRAECEALLSQVQSHATALSEERASSSSSVLELEQRVGQLTSELSTARTAGGADEQALYTAADEMQAQLTATRAESASQQAQMQSLAGVLSEERVSASSAVLGLEQRVAELTAELAGGAMRVGAPNEQRTVVDAVFSTERTTVEGVFATGDSGAGRGVEDAQARVEAAEGGESVFVAGLRGELEVLRQRYARDEVEKDRTIKMLRWWVRWWSEKEAVVEAELVEAHAAHARPPPNEQRTAIDAVFSTERTTERTTVEGVFATDAPAAGLSVVPMSEQARDSGLAADLQAQLNSAREEYAALQSQLQSHATALSEERASTSSTVLELEELKSELVGAQEGHVSTLDEQATRMEALQRALETQRAEMLTKLDHQRAEGESLQAHLDAAREDSTALQAQVESHGTELSLARPSSSTSEAVLVLERRVAELMEELAEALATGVASAPQGASAQAQQDGLFAAGPKVLKPSSLRDGAADFVPPAAVSSVYSPSRLPTMDEAIGQFVSSEQERDWLVAAAREASQSYETQRAELQAQLGAAKAEGATLLGQVQSHASELSEERASSSSSVLELEQRATDLQAQLVIAREGHAETADVAAPNFEALERSHETQRQELQAMVDGLRAEGASLQAQLDAGTVETASLQAQVESIAGELSEEQETLSSKSSSMAASLEAATLRSATLEQRVADLTAELVAARAELSSAVAEHAETADEHAAKVKALHDDHFATHAELQAQLTAARTASKEGIHGLGYHLSDDEREQREQVAVLHQIQQAMHAKRSIYGHSIKNSRDLFQSIDQDHSGMVDMKEFADALHRLDVGLSPPQVEALGRRLDRDGNGEIDYEDFFNYMHGDVDLTGQYSQVDPPTAVPSVGVAELEQRVAELNQQLFTQRASGEELTKQAAEQAELLADEAARSDALASQLKKLIAQESEAAAGVSQLQGQHQEMEARLVGMRGENEALSAQVGRLNAALAENEVLSAQVKRLNTALAEANAKLSGVADLQRVHLELEGSSGELEEQVFLLKAELAALAASHAQQLEKHSRWVEEVLKTAGLKAAEHLNSVLLAEREAHQEAIETAQEQHKRQADGLEADLNSSRGQVAHLETLQHDLETTQSVSCCVSCICFVD